MGGGFQRIVEKKRGEGELRSQPPVWIRSIGLATMAAPEADDSMIRQGAEAVGGFQQAQ